MNERSVLVVDADPGMQRHLSGLLQQWGYTPVPARSMEEALAALAHTRFLFSLVDWEVAGAGSLEFLRQLRNPGGDPGPIIVLADPGHTTRSEETPAPGADAILRKPIEPPKLEKAVAELLQHRYPGNVRELENFVKRMILLNDPGLPGAPQFPVGGDEIGGDAPEPAEAHPRSLKEIGRAAARAAEREAIAKALEQTGWNRVRAARLLRISYRALLYKIKDAGLGRGKPSSRFRKTSDLGTPLNG